MRKTVFTLLLLGASLPVTASAQLSSHEVDVAVGYAAQRGNGTTGTTFWQQGGMLELSAEAYRGFGVAMLLSGAHAGNLNMVTTTFGPRYTLARKKISVFGEGLIGESHGLDGVFPSRLGARSTFNTFALQVGGGVDLRLSRRVAVRPLQASWLRTEFPNATTNVQNNLVVEAGLVFRLQR